MLASVSLLADAGSMNASTMRVTMLSLRAGRKFLTPDRRLSNPTPPSFNRSVNYRFYQNSQSPIVYRPALYTDPAADGV